MISRASRMLTMVFDTNHISELFATVLYNLVFVSIDIINFVKGELIQAKGDMKSSKAT